MSKLIVVIGVTGNQGGSVARRFLKDPTWRVRGVTRDASKPAAQALAAQGMEIVAGDLDDAASLTTAFRGANAIFGVTDYWVHFGGAADVKLKPGQTINEHAYEAEVRQGMNVVDAAAAAADATLSRFVWSSLADAKTWSRGTWTRNFHFDSKARVAHYAQETYPALWKKTSLLLLGYYMTNWKLGMGPKKQADGSFVLALVGPGNSPQPFVDVNADTGVFVHALVHSSPGKKLLGYGGELTTHEEYIKLWAEINGVEGRYEEQKVEDWEKQMGPLGAELGDMFGFSGEFGYDGGDPEVIHPKDLGIQDQTVTLADYFKREDFSSIL